MVVHPTKWDGDSSLPREHVFFTKFSRMRRPVDEIFPFQKTVRSIQIPVATKITLEIIQIYWIKNKT